SVTDPGRHLVGFFDSVPDEGRAAALAGGEFGADRLAVRGEHAYLWCAAGILQSPLSKINWPARLGVEVTMRNWNTVLRLAAILAE
ncbi:MAG: hypothetical protein ACRDRL_09075, partial [Sciscionella sp.]